MNKKIMTYGIMFIVLISLIYAYSVTTFSDGTSSGNYTYNESGSFYKNISFPYWAVVTKAEIDLRTYWALANNHSYTLGSGVACTTIDILTTTSDGSYPNNFWLNCDSIIYKLRSNFTNISSFDTSPAIAAEITRLMTNATDGAEPTEFWGHNRDSLKMYGFNTTPTRFWNQTVEAQCDGGIATNITNANITEFFCTDIGKDLYRFNSTGNLTDTYGIPFCDAATGIWTNSSNERISTWWILCNLAANDIRLNQYDFNGTNLTLSESKNMNDFYVSPGGEQAKGLTSNIKNGEPTEFWIGYRNQGSSNEPVFIHISKILRNFTIKTNNEITYFDSSNFTGTLTDIDLNVSSLQECIDSVSSGNINCTLNFTSATAGTLEYSNLEVNYSVPLNITFRDEIDNTLINGETFSIFLEKTGFSQLYSTSNNPYRLNLTETGTYDMDVSSTNYPERQYTDIGITESRNAITIYLINSTDGTEKTFYVRDSTVTPIENTYINFTRLIGGTRTTVAEEQTDYDGAAKLYLDEDYEYRIIFEKSGYETKIINLEPTDDTYLITLTGSTEQYNASVYEGIRYKFEPSNIILQNNTNYNFTFTLNSSHWTLTNCTLYLKNGSDILNTTSSYNPDSCYLRIEYFIWNMTNITSEAVYELENLYNFTVSQQYTILYSYEGEFSLKSFLDDLTDFSMAGFDSFGRMILAFIAIFVILVLASMRLSIDNKDTLIIMFIALVGFFSFINWFYLDFAAMPDVLGLKKYFIFYLIIIVGFAYLINRLRR